METKNRGRNQLTFTRTEGPAVFNRGTVAVEARSPQDLVDAKIIVHPNYVIDRWGPQAAAEYTEAMGKRVGAQERQTAVRRG